METTDKKPSLILERGEETFLLYTIAKKVDWEPCYKTVYNWCTKGYRGIKLEYVLSPGGLRTSLEAYERFVLAIQELKDNS
jgi:hypothetical protein